MTSITPESRPTSAFRLFDVEVCRVLRLSPSFTRFTFGGSDLALFADTGYDQRIKLVLPLPGGGVALPEGEDWFHRWRALPPERRNPIRTYTVRAARPAEREVDVDIVLHGDVGPASRWAGRAEVGDRLAILGPNALFRGDPGGIEFDRTASGRPLLLAGDETAVPALASILERLPGWAQGEVLVEVPGRGDVLDLAPPPGISLTWLSRSGRPHGAQLAPAVREAAARLVPASGAKGDLLHDADDGTDLVWDVPEFGARPTSDRDGAACYAWLAGEAGVITGLRRHLVRDLGVDRRSVAFMGYWKLGRAES